MKKRNVDEETNGEPWMLCKKQHEINAWQHYIGHEINDSKVLDGVFYTPKILFMSHSVAQLR
jgi:hypothetical protein